MNAVVAAPPEVAAMAKTEPQAIYRKVCASGVSHADAAAACQFCYAVRAQACIALARGQSWLMSLFPAGLQAAAVLDRARAPDLCAG